ncbi:hypothetical protein F5Y19DRAFT_454875 [Xylariaceae sp. FL1651]|nr:hypothetical protein F5Y19DRAFT_454875 [Xylariaceae sp. FL1651]
MYTQFILTIFGILATTSLVALVSPVDPLAALVHISSSSTTCDDSYPSELRAINKSMTGRCIPTRQNVTSVNATITDEWNLFLFSSKGCTDKGGWVFPQTPENPNVCNYDVGSVAAFMVLGPNDTTNHLVGGLRGKLRQLLP